MEQPERVPARTHTGPGSVIPMEAQPAGRSPGRVRAGTRRVVFIGPDGTVVKVLRRHSASGGPAGHPLVGRPFSDLFEPEDREARVPDLLLEAAVAYGRSGMEGWRCDAEGRPYWWEVSLSSVGGADPAPGYVAVLRRRPVERRAGADGHAGAVTPPGPPHDRLVTALSDLVFNQLFAVDLTLRRVAAEARPGPDRVAAALDALDGAISDVTEFLGLRPGTGARRLDRDAQ